MPKMKCYIFIPMGASTVDGAQASVISPAGVRKENAGTVGQFVPVLSELDQYISKLNDIIWIDMLANSTAHVEKCDRAITPQMSEHTVPKLNRTY